MTIKLYEQKMESAKAYFIILLKSETTPDQIIQDS